MDKKQSCRTLWKNCFGDSETYMDYYFEEKWKNNIVLTKEVDNEVISMVHLNPYRLRWNKKEITSYYIVGVATKEEQRKKGYMRELLEKSFSLMKEEGVPFTYLMPANRKIYEPFGFKFIYEQERFRLHNIKKETITNEVSSKTIHELSENEWKQLLSFCNDKLSNEFDIYAIREENYYKNLQKEMEACSGEVRVFFKKEKVIGVMSYGIEEGVVEITESLIDIEETEQILNHFFYIVIVEKTNDFYLECYFLESYFLDKTVLGKYSEEIEQETKPIIMAKVLEEDLTEEIFCGQKLCEQNFSNQKVYLNEIV